MEGVEDIPGAVMHEGLEDLEVSQYLDALEGKPHDADVCALLPHAAVRVNVMGDRAVAMEPATADDIEKMRAIAEEAVEGAFGVSTSRIPQNSLVNTSRRVYEDELMGLANGLKDAGGGFMEAVSDWITDTSENMLKPIRTL